MCGFQHHPQVWISKIRTSNLQGNISDLLYFTYIRCSIETYSYDQHIILALYILISDLILLVQNFVDAGEAGVEGIAAAIRTYKGSLNRSWGCSGKILLRSSQYSASTEMEHSNGILAEFRDRV